MRAPLWPRFLLIHATQLFQHQPSHSHYYKAQLLQPVFYHITSPLALNTSPAPLVHCLLLSAACAGLSLFPHAHPFDTQSFIIIYLRQLYRTCKYLNFAPHPLPPLLTSPTQFLQVQRHLADFFPPSALF